jgi:hypothetical protein
MNNKLKNHLTNKHLFIEKETNLSSIFILKRIINDKLLEKLVIYGNSYTSHTTYIIMPFPFNNIKEGIGLEIKFD